MQEEQRMVMVDNKHAKRLLRHLPTPRCAYCQKVSGLLSRSASTEKPCLLDDSIHTPSSPTSRTAPKSKAGGRAVSLACSKGGKGGMSLCGQRHGWITFK